MDIFVRCEVCGAEAKVDAAFSKGSEPMEKFGGKRLRPYSITVMGKCANCAQP